MLKEEMMSEYTAEDFEKAMFAEHPDPVAVDARYAARMNRDPEFPWLLDGVPGNGDEHMARDGWVPVVKSATGNDRRVERLKRQVTEQDITICRRNREIEELNRRVRALEEVEAAPGPWQAIADAMPSDWPKEVREHAAKTLHEAGVKMGEK